MPTLVISKTYADGDILFEADLDNIRDDLENFINTTKLNDDNIQDAGITAATKLIDGSISSSKIASGAVTTSKIEDAAITTPKIVDSGVTTVKIADSNITTAKIADGAVTQAKRVSLGQQISSSSGAYSTSSITFGDVTNLSVSITTTGRPVYISLIPASGASNSGFQIVSYGADVTQFDLRIVRDSTTIASSYISFQGDGNVAVPFFLTTPVGSLHTIDVPSAGTYTYKVQARVNGTSIYGTVEQARLVAFEL